jgi:hypothetical protein
MAEKTSRLKEAVALKERTEWKRICSVYKLTPQITDRDMRVYVQSDEFDKTISLSDQLDTLVGRALDLATDDETGIMMRSQAAFASSVPRLLALAKQISDGSTTTELNEQGRLPLHDILYILGRYESTIIHQAEKSVSIYPTVKSSDELLKHATYMNSHIRASHDLVMMRKRAGIPTYSRVPDVFRTGRK